VHWLHPRPGPAADSISALRHRLISALVLAERLRPVRRCSASMRRAAPLPCRRRSQSSPGCPCAGSRRCPGTGLPAGSADGASDGPTACAPGRFGSRACANCGGPAAARWPRRRAGFQRSIPGHGGRLPSRPRSSASICANSVVPTARWLSCPSSYAISNQPGALPRPHEAGGGGGWAAGSLLLATAPWPWADGVCFSVA